MEIWAALAELEVASAASVVTVVEGVLEAEPAVTGHKMVANPAQQAR